MNRILDKHVTQNDFVLCEKYVHQNCEINMARLAVLNWCCKEIKALSRPSPHNSGVPQLRRTAWHGLFIKNSPLLTIPPIYNSKLLV